MTVRELIAKLEKEDGDREIYVSREDGLELAEGLWEYDKEYLVID